MLIFNRHWLYTLKIESHTIHYTAHKNWLRAILLPKKLPKEALIPFDQVKDFSVSTFWLGFFLSVTIHRQPDRYHENKEQTVKLWLNYKEEFLKHLFKVITKKSKLSQHTHLQTITYRPTSSVAQE